MFYCGENKDGLCMGTQQLQHFDCLLLDLSNLSNIRSFYNIVGFKPFQAEIQRYSLINSGICNGYYFEIVTDDNTITIILIGTIIMNS